MRHCHWTRLPTNRKTVFIFLLNFPGNKPIGKIYDRSPSHLEHRATISLINEIRKWIKECYSFTQRWCFLRKNQEQRSVCYTQRTVGFLHIRRHFTQRYAALTQRSGCFLSKGQAVFTPRSGSFECKGQVVFTQRSEDIFPKVRCFLLNGKAVICARVMLFFHAKIRLFFKQESSGFLCKGHAVFSCEDQAVFTQCSGGLFFIFIY